jgi:hypothetical protein
MSYSVWAGSIIPPMVSAFTPCGVLNSPASNPASGAFESANRAIYMPVLVPVACAAQRLWWANGSAVSAAYNVDCGIYADAGFKPGARLVSTGSTAQGTANQVQFVDITDLHLVPGLYWIALACSSVSASFFRLSYPQVAKGMRLQQASALPLPATATPADGTDGGLYVFGFATTASP